MIVLILLKASDLYLKRKRKEKKMKEILKIMLFALLWQSCILANTGIQKPKVNGKLFMHIRQLWIKKDYKNLLPLMNQRVRTNLSRYRRRWTFPREQVSGILKEHFAQITIISFSYDVKKTNIARGVAFYTYRKKNNGILEKKILYFYLQKHTGKKPSWCISQISVLDCPNKSY